MDRNTFMEQLGEFADGVRREGLRLFDNGVSGSPALKLAIDIVTAQPLTKAEELARLAAPIGHLPRIPRGN